MKVYTKGLQHCNRFVTINGRILSVGRNEITSLNDTVGVYFF